MKTVNKILVAIDFSDYSLPLVRYASHLAKDVGAELILVNVYNQRDIDMLKTIDRTFPQFSFQKYFEESIQDREKLLADLIAKSPCRELGIKTKLVVRHGVPYQELLEEIRVQKADLLVMGTKGRSDLVDTIIGSCAHKMFRRSPIPILSLRSKT
jgi:nucleotide-binding universal stress UspA family protein